MIKVLVADNHELARQGMRAMLEAEKTLEVVGEAKDGMQAVSMAKELSPDIILMDVRMPRMDGVTACREIKKSMPERKVVMLSIYDDDDDVFGAIDAGASGYLIKDFTSEELIHALDVVQQDQSFLHPIVTKKLSRKFRNISDKEKTKMRLFTNLTRRELEVLQMVCQGLSNGEIAKALFLSEGTIKSHVSNILHKVNKRDRTQLTLYAIENRMTEKSLSPF